MHVHCMRVACLCVSIVRTCPAPACTCPAHTCAQSLLARGCHASFVCIDLSPRLLAYGRFGGCTQAPRHIWCPLSQATTIGEGAPFPQKWARSIDPYIATRHGRLWFTSFSPLPSPCPAETSHLSSNPHNTLVCNHPPPHPHTLHTACKQT